MDNQRMCADLVTQAVAPKIAQLLSYKMRGFTNGLIASRIINNPLFSLSSD